ncbi:MAG: DUF3137 domain-containing protein [Chitinophagales bacterium]|jgi:hypothetical protein|nr:DUF3137 domain-containing protein [Bacteroidota bacterium]MBP8916638.1 DUF3137 domain-containing protein [Chitinophagales bacterium]MBP9220928.1 DUF3137 domain-containing protein [Chitinophagales bacterium]MBP9795457.1 DUF3137 domain-containing protein [Chitinophagales bacterium]
MKTVEELQQYYQQEIVPHLSALEVLRKQQLNRVMFMWIAGCASLLLGFITMIPTLILVFLLISLLMYFFIFGFKRNRTNFRTEYKKIVIGKLMQFIAPDLAFTPNLFITQNKYDLSKIFLSNPDIYSGEDLVTGKIEKTQVEFCELHTQDRQTDHKGRTTYVTIFKGLFFIADFNKHFNGQTYVLSDFGERFLGFFGKLMQNINVGRPDVVRLEDPEFEKIFVVYSSDEVEARYILSTSFMERLVEFRKKMNSSVQLSFVGSNMYMAIPMKKNLFEPSLRRTVMNFNDIQEYYKQILFCTSIVDEMNLNTRVWTKS